MIWDERGTTIIELILVVAIIALIVGVLARTMYQVVTITDRGNAEMVVQHDLRNAATWLNRDVLSASKATVSGSQMVLEVPDLRTTPEVTTTISYITYTYSADTGNLTRDGDGSAVTVARHIASTPFTPTGVITAPNVVTVTLYSLEGNVPGSGTFALKMRAGVSIQVEGLCQINGAGNLDINPSSKTVGWDITNSGSDTASIEQIIIEWPSTNGRLTEIWFGTSRIFAEWRDPPSATIIKPLWGGEPEDRTIDGDGIPKKLEFRFETTDISENEDLYSIEITFDNGCIVSFPQP